MLNIVPRRGGSRLPARRVFIAISIVAAPLASGPGFAQQNVREVERRFDSVSPNGVSYPSGSFSYSVPLLKVGDGRFPKSLSFDLSYNSGSDKFPGTAWTDNIDTRTSMTLVDDPYATVPDPDGKPHVSSQTWQYNIVYGHQSQAFEKYGNPLLYLNPFRPTTITGATLSVGTASNGSKYFVYTTADGDVLTLRPNDATIAPGKGDSYRSRDGVRQRYNYGTLFSVSNNLGWAILYQRSTSGAASSATVCAINLTQYYLANLAACPPDAPKVSFVVPTSGTGKGRVTSITETDGGIHQFTYSGRAAASSATPRPALTCVKKPGSTQCDVVNSFDACDSATGYIGGPTNQSDYDNLANGSRDRVTRQTFPDGTHVDFTWANQNAGCRFNPGVTVTDPALASTVLTTDSISGTVLSAVDPLSRQRSFAYTGALSEFSPSDLLVENATSPEGDKVIYTYDGRGNVVQTRFVAKPGSGLADVVTSANFPAECSNDVPCNKPSSTTDANGGVTNFTYDPTHWGVLSQEGPAVDGVRFVKRFEYAQRYAWLKTAAGGYAAADEPVWLLSRERTCRTSATVAGVCAGGSSDEVTTEYDYGPNSGPNNLLLRGVAVTSGGVTLRSCFGYDGIGRKVSETKPSANVQVCP